MNPGAASKAVEAYEGFHWGRKATRARRVRVSPPPRELAQLGKLVAVTYETTKGEERAQWEHEFGEEGGRRPVLAVDPESNRLHIVGGDYRVEDRGIVD
jgi:hypothetical protein